MEARKEGGELKLCHVGVLKLVYANVFEAMLIAFSDLGEFFEQNDGLHNDIVKIQRVGFTQEELVLLIDAGDLLLTEVHSRLHSKIVGGHELVLGAADGVHHALDGEHFFVDLAALHGGKDGFFGVVGVVDGDSRPISQSLAVLSQDAHTNRVEGACNDVRGHRLIIGEHLIQTLLHLVCRLVGKGNGKNAVGLAGVAGKGWENMLLDLGGRQRKGVFQLAHASIVHVPREIFGKIGVAVADDKGDAAHQDRGLSASRAGKHQKGIVYGEHRLSLALVERGIDFIKQSALGSVIAFFNSRHKESFLWGVGWISKL